MDSNDKQFQAIRRHYVQSRSMRSIGYEPTRHELDIEYPSREVYRYFGVPPEEYAAFIAAESKGTYLNSVFKQRNYRYTVLQHKKIA